MMCNARMMATAMLLAANAAHGGEPPAMQALDDGELRAVTRPQAWRQTTRSPAAVTGAQRTASPLFGNGDTAIAQLRTLKLLNADIEIKDVKYGSGTLAWPPAQDGSYRLPLPATIGEIDVRNIRCGPNDTANFGSVQIQGIDLQNTSITVSRNK